MIDKFVIYGERCSGTNYLECLIKQNFNVTISFLYGHKHFFGFEDKEKLKNAHDTLFICITRDICKWINSFFRELHHHPLKYNKTLTKEERLDNFLNEKWFSVNDYFHNYKTWTSELKINDKCVDRNIYTNKKYDNIFELRHIKHKYLLKELPKLVPNYIFIRYEDLINNFEKTMYAIKEKGLVVKDDKIFPVNTNKYKKSNKIFKEKKDYISCELILNHKSLNKKYEIKLEYIK